MNKRERQRQARAALYKAPARQSGLPPRPEIPQAVLDFRTGLDWELVDGERCRRYIGPIEIGMIFAWEPDIPTARQLVVVCDITGPGEDRKIKHPGGTAIISGGHEPRIWTLDLDSPMRGQPDRWRAAMWHLARHYIAGAPVWNDESRFREAVVATMFKPQNP